MKSIILISLLLSSLAVFAAEEGYVAPKLSLGADTPSELVPDIQKQDWVEPPKLHSEKDVERSIASEPESGRNPSSSKKELFSPWLYKQ